jgi:GNAT superfamily N-acetyltransferase
MSNLRQTAVFADLALARRLERAEGLACAESAQARAIVFPDSGAESQEIGGANVVFDGANSPITQTFGLGMVEAVDDALLDRVEEFFKRRAAPVYHEVCPLADPSLLPLLHRRGYEPFEYSSAMFRPWDDDLVNTLSESNGITARTILAGEEDLWARTAADGWRDAAPGLDEFIFELARLIPHRPSGPCFLAEKGGEPIAAGAMGLFNGVALLAGACTIPKWRGQGAQRALLAHRLRYGAEHGCDLAMIVAAPGSASQRNAEREGFRIAYTRLKWRLPATIT